MAVAEPRIETCTYLDVPRPLTEALQTELIGDLRGVHGVGQILLVGKDEEESVTKLVLVKHALELLACLRDTFSVVGVDNEDDSLSVLEVCAGSVSEERSSQES